MILLSITEKHFVFSLLSVSPSLSFKWYVKYFETAIHDDNENQDPEGLNAYIILLSNKNIRIYQKKKNFCDSGHEEIKVCYETGGNVSVKLFTVQFYWGAINVERCW